MEDWDASCAGFRDTAWDEKLMTRACRDSELDRAVVRARSIDRLIASSRKESSTEAIFGLATVIIIAAVWPKSLKNRIGPAPSGKSFRLSSRTFTSSNSFP